uniref:Uncharacterized protein n=1 Tax=Chromera velia CCMP2878 TaxID=1169474 RepID=A0A0G4HD54_9ALVE|eukprot:Cvel_6364.t1-p1 / transcript=Cvel_6364.t1 / gene=Cvel_6364 / organism=Chromera_velia_CCMP2878 / gene_product=N(6)-adenine-specific DNA methyltransferase 2, putative / transcript_product=N(6)-adenine-specific DNA methyltransferase 2, putative / location=Cvel_scaffold309:99208-100104(+) / protein_length=261 / sequence_SO=supercontig / SO=protein_coding / is_pseudo=false
MEGDEKSEGIGHVPLGEEDLDLSQFWYSEGTLKVLVDECITALRSGEGCVYFLSTPSVFFAMPEEYRDRLVLFEFDKRWEEKCSPGRFVFFDFNQTEEFQLPGPVGASSAGHQSRKPLLIVADPPRLQADCLRCYFRAFDRISKESLERKETPSDTSSPDSVPRGPFLLPGLMKVILTSVSAFGPMIANEANLHERAFRPFLPSLALSHLGHFRLYSNFSSTLLETKNGEFGQVRKEKEGDEEEEEPEFESASIGMVAHEI